MTRPVTDWTAEKVSALQALWPSDLTATQIGAALGASKGSVIAKASRLGLAPKAPEACTTEARRDSATARRFSFAGGLGDRGEDDDNHDPCRTACDEHLADLMEHHPLERYPDKGIPAEGVPTRISRPMVPQSYSGSPAAMCAAG